MLKQIVFLQADTSSLMNMLPFVAMLIVLYFFIIRPQVTKQKKEKKFQETIKKGSKVVTTSGIHGRISELNNDGTVIIETGAGKIKFERAAISMEFSKKYITNVKK